jgi:hypothetical protein
MGNERLVRKSYKCKPLGIRTAGRPEHMREVDVMRNLQLLKIKNWTYSIQNREEWGTIVDRVNTFKE